jgi:hypothetical protein
VCISVGIDTYVYCMMSLSVLVMLGLQVSFATTYDSNVLSLSGRIFVAVTFVRFFNLHSDFSQSLFRFFKSLCSGLDFWSRSVTVALPFSSVLKYSSTRDLNIIAI